MNSPSTNSASAIILARLSSSRFPGKVLKFLNGMPLLDHLLLRLNKSECFSEIILATSTDSLDDDLVTWANCRNIKICIIGSLSNVFQDFMKQVCLLNQLYSTEPMAIPPFQNPLFNNQSLKQLETSNSEFITGKSRFTQFTTRCFGWWITKDAREYNFTVDSYT